MRAGAPMSSDDDDRTAPVPPPPATEGGPRPPDLTAPNVEGKAAARSVGIDTMFIDGLTEGLAEELPEPLLPTTGKVSDAASDGDANDEAPSSAAAEDEPAPSEDAPTLFFEPGAVEDERPQPSEDIPKPASAGAAAAASTRAVAAASATPRAESQPIPKAWFIAGGALVVFGLAFLFRGSGGAPPEGSAASSNAVAQHDGQPGEGDGDGARAGGGASEAGRGADGKKDGRADGSASSEDEPEGAGGGAADGGGAAEGETDAGADRDEPGSEAGEAGEADEADGEEVVEIMDDAAQPSGKSGSSTLPPSRDDPNRAAEEAMSAEELLAAAKDAYKERRYRDAYRLANQSHRKKASDDALELRAKAACGMKDRDLAKTSFKKLPLGERRREVRDACRKHDIRIGI